MCTDRKSQLQRNPADVSDNKTDVVLYLYTQVCICIENSMGGHREAGDDSVSGGREIQKNVFLLRHVLD